MLLLLAVSASEHTRFYELRGKTRFNQKLLSLLSPKHAHLEQCDGLEGCDAWKKGRKKPARTKLKQSTWSCTHNCCAHSGPCKLPGVLQKQQTVVLPRRHRKRV